MTETQRIVPNIEACIDCGGCEVACKRTWDLSHEDERMQVIPQNVGKQGTSYTGGEANVPMNCYHCAKPPCEPVCPTDAITKKDNGLVRVNKDKCIGCLYCLMACPFGAPQFPEEEVSGGLAGLMDKCTLCEPRLNEGKNPACVDECPTDALIFGTTSEISDQVRERLGETLFTGGLESVVFGED